jgi:hypothetical protein
MQIPTSISTQSKTHRAGSEFLRTEGISALLCATTTGACKSSGSLAMFAAILRASSLLSNLAANRRPGSSSK